MVYVFFRFFGKKVKLWPACVDTQTEFNLRRVVVDESLSLYPEVLSSISGSPSLSDETLNCGPIFWDA